MAAGLGIKENTLYNWIAAAKRHGEAAAFPGSGVARDLEDENKKLKEQLRIALMERDILKKTIAFFARPQNEKFEAIHQQRKLYPLPLLLRVLGVSKSGYYDWRREGSTRAERFNADQKLLRCIEAIHFAQIKITDLPP